MAALCLMLALGLLQPVTFDSAASSGQLTVRVVSREGAPLAGASLYLYDETYAPLGEAQTDAQGQARFEGLPLGLYILEAYWLPGDGYPSGFFLGAHAVRLSEASATFEFRRTSPYIDDVSWEGGQDGKLVGVFTVRNPGPLDLPVKLVVALDRDGAPPYDAVATSKERRLAAGGAVSLEVELKPREVGSYRWSAWLVSRYLRETVTDSAPWTDGLTVTGGLSVRVLSRPGLQGEVALALFNTAYRLEGGLKRVALGERAEWQGLTEPRYIVEVYFEPKEGLRLAEFWGAKTLTVREKTHTLKPSTPTVKRSYYAPKSLEPGEIVKFRVLVASVASAGRPAKVALILDRDGKPPFDLYVESEPKPLRAGREVFALAATLTEPGKYRVYIVVQAQFNGQFLVTSQTPWRPGPVVIKEFATLRGGQLAPPEP